MTLEDPMLRQGIEKRAKKGVGEAGVAKFMDLDAQAAQYAKESQSEETWKQQEARQIAYKQRRVQATKHIRKITVLPFCMSLLLLNVDGPKIGRVFDGMILLVVFVCATYLYIPHNPQKQSKKTADDAETPLLGIRQVL